MFKDSWTLVTGASSGIGLELARLIAARGGHLVLVARNAERLEACAQNLRQAHGVQVLALPTDLGQRAQIEALLVTLRERGLRIDHLVNNAGAGSFGDFFERPLDGELTQVMLNAVAPLALMHALAPAMLGRADAGVLNIASSAAFQPTPYMATYGATKAFLLMLSEAVQAEHRPHRLRVTCACPGPTDTPFFDTPATGGAMRKAVSNTGMADAAGVARAALAAYEAGRVTAVIGLSNQALVQSVRITPRRVISRVVEFLLRPRGG